MGVSFGRLRAFVGTALAAGLVLTMLSWEGAPAPAANAVTRTVGVQSTEAQKPTLDFVGEQVGSISLVANLGVIAADEESETTLTATVLGPSGAGIVGEVVTFTSSDPGQRIGTPVDNGNGTYSAVLTSSRTIGDALIKAQVGVGDQLKEARVRVLQINPPPAVIKFFPTTATLVADGKDQVVVSVKASDKYGDPAGATLSWTFPIQVGAVTATWTAVSGNEYRGVITASKKAGHTTVGARVGNAVGSFPVHLVAGPAAELTAQLGNSTLTADGTSTTWLTAQVADANGNPVSGDTVTVTSDTAGVSVGRVRDQGAGKYTAEVTSVRRLGDVTFTVANTSVEPHLTQQLTLTLLPGPLTNLTAELDAPAILADGQSTTTVTAKATDAYGNPRADDLLLLTGPGLPPLPMYSNGDGQYRAEIPASKRAGTEVFTVTAPDAPSSIERSVTLTRLAGPAHELTANLANDRLTADGVSWTKLMITAADLHGNAIAGEPIAAVGSDDIVVGPITDIGDGTYTAEVTARTVAGSATITVTDTSVAPALTRQVPLTLVAGEPAEADLVLEDDVLPADGESETTLEASIRDAHGNAVSNAALAVTSDDPGQWFSAAQETAPGVYRLTVRTSTTPGKSTLTVGTPEEPRAANTLRAAAGAASPSELARALATIDLEQREVPVPLEQRPSVEGATGGTGAGGGNGLPESLARSGSEGERRSLVAVGLLLTAGGALLLARRARTTP
ncbi:Ig-like domain-containing protein [Leucobacter komagatae]|uniref:Big-1 domain-containing protein n=1 Tax=Leucobacter komagatae TaxID=55969 RepID=A0A0D0ITN4_9MICO|nr:Ig-like domain-containing protein [Leucobacter komagatae]KIP52903.1 hypothetical protein SD72_06930 [Leucobacter komagatae]